MTKAWQFMHRCAEFFDSESVAYKKAWELLVFDRNLHEVIAHETIKRHCASYKGVKNGGRVWQFSDGTQVNVRADGGAMYVVSQR